ncbi:MAG: diguanylate cyclase [Cellvibrionaceae bacterium]
MRLSYKTSGLVLLSAVIPAAVVLAYTLWIVEDARHQSLLEKIHGHLELGAETLSEEFIRARNEVEVFTQLTPLKEMNKDAFLPLLKAQLAHHSGRYEKFIIGTPEGHFYNTAGGNPFLGMKRTFDDSRADSEPKSLSKRDYWQATVGNNRDVEPVSFISSPMVSYTTGARQVVVASSILDDGELKGMLGIAIDWERIVSLIQHVQKEAFNEYEWDPRLFLTAKDGSYWYHWDPLRIISLARDKEGHLLKDENNQVITAAYSLSDEGIPVLAEEKTKIVAGESGFLAYDNLHGEAHYLFYAPVRSAGYSLGLMIAKKNLSQPLLNTFGVLIVFLVGVGVVLLLGVLWSRKMIVRPAGQLLQQIACIRDGDFLSVEPFVSDDEFSELSDKLQEMSTAIVKREKNMRANEDRFNCAMAGTNDGLWDWNLYTDEVYFSERCLGMLGYGLNEVEHTQEAFFQLIHPDDQEPTERYIKEFLGGMHQRYHLVFRMVHKDSSVVHILSRAFLVRNSETKRPERLIGTHVDITEQKQFEQEISQLNAQLELRVKERTRELEKANHKLETLSLQDVLTELGNRRAMEADLNRIHSLFVREMRRYSVLLVDVDYFKIYNDFYGHQMGDEILRKIAQLLKDAVRKNDRVYRYGGEEFLIVLPETEIPVAKNIGERAVDLIREIKIVHEKSSMGYVSISMGVTTVLDGEDSWSLVVKRADEMLYQAKELGRDQAVSD